MISGFSSNESQVLKNSHIKILLLENVNQTAVQLLSSQGYQVEFQTKALSEEDLIEKIKDVHVVGIRSKTKITAKVLDAAKCLLAIGCFCIGTNQVDLEHAASKGVAVFNSPFSNSRSVAELVIAEIITLSRQLGDRNREIHQGQWNKVSKGCYEVRGKTLGIVGYGHIGSQLSVLAEALGMYVHFYDVLQIMPIGQARYTNTLGDLLAVSDFVSLHVPETDETKNMIGKAEIEQMKKGSYLINASRGTVVDIPALVEGLKSGHLAGAAVDVYPSEPSKNGDNFVTELQNCPNTILSPHIGGSTEEAQFMIGQEVGNALLNYLERGSSLGAVNFPNVDLRGHPSDLGTIRVLYVHHNVPGVLKQINNILSDYNVEKQTVESKGPIAYLLADLKVTDENSKLINIHESIKDTTHNILTRIIT